MTARPGLRVLLAVLVTSVLTGCVSMPVDGPVATAGEDSGIRNDDPADIVVQPPTPGESPTDIVVHFLDAMTASPLSTSVARKYLTEAGADAWQPEREIITYADKSRPDSGTSPIRVSLVDANHLDARGSWLGALSRPRSVLRFPVELENGEWRISRAPNALIVPDTWFEPRFQQVSLYFFDPTGSVVVPEPVYLPRGDQLPTALTSNLLQGPPVGLEDVYRTFFPAGLTSGLSVPVSRAGVAEVALQGDDSQLTPETTDLMLGQLAWTLRQVPGIDALRVSIGGRPIDVPGDADVLPVDSGAAYDPTGMLASPALFALRQGLLVSGSLEDLRPVDGPFGQADQGVRTIAVNPDASRVAGVTDSGRVLVAPVSTTGRQVHQVASGASDLLPPAWDLAGRLWLVDRRPGGAIVSVVRGGRPVPVTAPGITGERVRTFTVSRDGTRLVAVLVGEKTDVVVVSRIGLDRGRLVLTRARSIRSAVAPPQRVRDLGWRTPTTLVVLSLLTEGLSQVRTVSLDGSPGGTEAPATTLRGRIRWLVSSPVDTQPVYAVSPQGAVDLADAQRTVRPEGVSLATLTYVG
jgi:hypothetical protein